MDCKGDGFREFASGAGDKKALPSGWEGRKSAAIARRPCPGATSVRALEDTRAKAAPVAEIRNTVTSTVTMLKKYGKFYSRWTGPDGKRHVKAHATKKEAERHQARMRAEAKAKKAQPTAPPLAR